jgi:prepilin-type N-terminal cleavage/methylation domain-containing protein
MLARRILRSDQGYTLMEVLVTIALIGVLFSIAYPIYFGQQPAGYTRTAQSDVEHIGADIVTELAGQYTFGDNNGTISLTETGYIAFSTMSNASPYASGPGVTNMTTQLSPDSVMDVGTYGAGDGLHWCVRVVNHGQPGVYTEKGLQRAAVDCYADGTASATAVTR